MIASCAIQQSNILFGEFVHSFNSFYILKIHNPKHMLLKLSCKYFGKCINMNMNANTNANKSIIIPLPTTFNKQQRHNIVIVSIVTLYTTHLCIVHMVRSYIFVIVLLFILFTFRVKSLLFHILFSVLHVWCPDNGSRTSNSKRKYLWKHILFY